MRSPLTITFYALRPHGIVEALHCDKLREPLIGGELQILLEQRNIDSVIDRCLPCGPALFLELVHARRVEATALFDNP